MREMSALASFILPRPLLMEAASSRLYASFLQRFVGGRGRHGRGSFEGETCALRVHAQAAQQG